MKTPIADFAEKYKKSGASRFHMPGHKGKGFLGVEDYDITEVEGADVLSHAHGIIGESEENLSSLFSSAHSFYITQGSTTGIYAMLSLLEKAKGGVVLAARNAHKAFVQGCALLDLSVKWLMPKEFSHILSCSISPKDVEEGIRSCGDERPLAVYLTSPDYLGNLQDIEGISKVCRKYGVPLIVDNAHGAYLKFLEKSLHPLDLGADMCCDSAHKTLPVLTGGAYLHISKSAPKEFVKSAREKIALFSSTSPSYLVLQSLDKCNVYLEKDFRTELRECIKQTEEAKMFLKDRGFSILEGEPLKIVVDGRKSGICCLDVADALRKHKVEPEFHDRDFLVLMASPKNSKKDFRRIKKAFLDIEPKEERKAARMSCPEIKKAVSIREAILGENEEISVKDAQGKICASPMVSCPPAVPIVVSGEVVTSEAVKLLEYYGVEKIRVLREN